MFTYTHILHNIEVLVWLRKKKRKEKKRKETSYTSEYRVPRNNFRVA